MAASMAGTEKGKKDACRSSTAGSPATPKRKTSAAAARMHSEMPQAAEIQEGAAIQLAGAGM